jgi:hypothetical protein
MPRPLLNLGREQPLLLDIRSYARPGPARRDRLSSAQVALIARTVHRTPEVMVKMLNQGGTSLRAVRRHIQYLDRGGELVIETDDGEPLKGKGALHLIAAPGVQSFLQEGAFVERPHALDRCGKCLRIESP